MSERKINLDEFIDDMPFACSQYKTKIKAEMLEFSKQLLELAAENAILKRELYFHLSDAEKLISSDIWEEGCFYPSEGIVVNKQSILDTIKQVE